MPEIVFNNTATYPLVTDYILNYNYGKYLPKCIDSVLAQTYHNIEIFIIDDGSTDNSKNILSEYGSTYKEKLNIKFQENSGLVKSILRAFDLSNGVYVVRIDADDWVEPSFVEDLVNVMHSDDQLAMVFPDYYEVDEYGHIIKQIKRYDFHSEVTLLDQPAHGACTLIRKKMYYEVGGLNIEIDCQDVVAIWLALTERYKVTNLKKSLFYYRQHNSSLTRNYTKILRNRARIYEDHALRRGYKSEGCTAFLPIRSDIVNGKEFVFNKIKGKYIIEWVFEKYINSQELSSLVISTDSLDIIQKFDYFKGICKKHNKGIDLHARGEIMTKQGVSIDDSIIDYYNRKDDVQLSPIVILTPLNPFSNHIYVDTAIHYAYIFNVDNVDSVVENNSLLYYHDGNGMKQLGGSTIRHERDNVYLRRGGISLYSKNKLMSLLSKDNNKSLVSGHIVLDNYHAFEVKNNLDVKLANTLADNITVTI